MVLLKLFYAFLKIELFAMGGAYSLLPLTEKEVVDTYCWLTREEFLDILGITTTLPGAISIKFATYVGYKVAGIAGVVAANLGNIIAPAFLTFVASFFYIKYKDLPTVKAAFSAIQFAMFAMIISVAFQLIDLNQLAQPKSLGIVAISAILFSYAKIQPAIIIVLAGIVGILLR